MSSAQEIERDLRSKTVTILRVARNIIKNNQKKLGDLGESGKKQQSQFRNAINVAIDATDVETIKAYILYQGAKKKSSAWGILSVPVCVELNKISQNAKDMNMKLARARLFFGYLNWAYSIWSKGDDKMKEEFWDLKQA